MDDAISRAISDRTPNMVALRRQLHASPEWLSGIARSIVGDGPAEIEPLTGGEDMSEFLYRVPGCFALIGGAIEGAAAYHSPTFNFDEKALPIGAELFVRAAADYLS
jgi:metal-dependent amidase/aminoacylase/carboxypeptidase family protein